MDNRILGLHHVTAITDSAQRNYNFYSKMLGLRLAKKTVNFDDPGTYHFYYGDERVENPLKEITLFRWKLTTVFRSKLTTPLRSKLTT